MNDPFEILLVDDDPVVIGVMSRILKEVGRVRFATSGLQALQLAGQLAPDVVLLDVEMPGLSGFEVCTAMKQDDSLRDVPVIFLTSHDGDEQEVTGLTLGGADFIAKPPRAAQVVARVRTHLRMKQMADALRDAAYTDGLTGIANRRRFDETLQREWLRAQREGTPTSLLMIDIDLFKKYNDHCGHPAGDRCLRAVAQALQQALHRPADLAARCGGEEFALLLPHTNADGACEVARRVLHAVDGLQIAHIGSPVAPHVTISVGVTALADRIGERPVADLVSAADRALYAAKEAGRHRAMFLGIGDPGLATRAVLPARAQAVAAPQHGARRV